MSTTRSLEGATEHLVLSVMLAGLAPALVLGAVVLVTVDPFVGLLVAVVIAGAWALFVRARAAGAAERVLAPLAASPVRPGGEPRLENLIESVCVVSGLEEPSLAVLPGDQPNALAVADGTGSTFVLTRGLLDELGRVELEAVLANLAARVRTGAARYVATVLALPLPSSYAQHLLSTQLGEQSSIRSDLDAVGLTKYPPGLISAFATMERTGTQVSAASPATASLWLADPTSGPDSSASPHSEPLALRIAVLQEL